MSCKTAVPFAIAFVLTVGGARGSAGQAIPLLSRDVKELEALARSDSNDAEIQFYLALGNWKRHRWQQVDSLLRLAVQLEPRFAEAYLALYYLPFARRPALYREEERGRVPEAWRPAVDEAYRFYQRAFRTDPLVSLRVMAVAFEIEEPRFTDYTSEEFLIYERYYAWLVDLGLGRYRSAHERLTRLAQRLWDEDKHPDKVPDYVLWYRGLAAAHSFRYAPAIVDFQSLLDRARKQEQKDEIVHVPLRINEYRFMLAALHHVAGHADSAISRGNLRGGGQGGLGPGRAAARGRSRRRRPGGAVRFRGGALQPSADDRRRGAGPAGDRVEPAVRAAALSPRPCRGGAGAVRRGARALYPIPRHGLPEAGAARGGRDHAPGGAPAVTEGPRRYEDQIADAKRRLAMLQN